MLKFGELLKELRKEKKLTQKELADELELDQSSISKYESYKKLPDVDTMMKMAIVFDIPVQRLIDSRNYTAHGITPNGSYGLNLRDKNRDAIIYADRVSEPGIEKEEQWNFRTSKYSAVKFDEEALKNIPWEVDGQEVSPEEVEEAIKYIKFQRSLRDKNK